MRLSCALDPANFPRLPVLLVAALVAAAILAPSGTTSARPRHARRRLPLQRGARTSAEPLPGREDRPPAPAHEDGRGRAARPRRRPPALPGISFSHGAARADDARRARAGSRLPARPPLRVAVRRDARERGARGRPPRGERDQDRRRRHRRDVTHPTSRRRRPRPGTSSTTARASTTRTATARSSPRSRPARSTNGEGIAGFGGDAQLLVVKAVGAGGQLHRRRRGGRDRLRGRPRREDHQSQSRRRRHVSRSSSRPSSTPRATTCSSSRPPATSTRTAIRSSTPPPCSSRLGSNGQGGVGLSVAASTMAGKRAYFSNTGSQISLAAPGEQRLRRDRARLRAAVVAALRAPRLARGPLRLVERHVVRDARGRRRGRTRLGGEPVADRAAGRGDPQGDRVRARPVESAARLRRDRRRGRGRECARPAGRARVQGGLVAEPPPSERPAALDRSRRPGSTLRALRLAVHLRTSAPVVSPDYRSITLQVRRGGSWHRLARATTRTGGGIRWTVGLRPGRYMLRVVYRGRWDLRAAIRLGRCASARPGRARSGRRARAGARRSARSPGRSGRRCRSSTRPRRRGSRSASPCPRGCPGSPSAGRTAASAR